MNTRLHSFRNDGLVFDVTDSGPLNGEIVVLLHGFPQTADSWAAVAADLNQRGYRTLAPNQRGYSPGARPRGRLAYRGSKLVGDLKALIKASGADAVHLVGHDWGAAVAWMMAAAHPEQVRSLTTASVPHPLAFYRSFFNSDQLFRSFYMLVFQLPILPEWLIGKSLRRSAQGLTGIGMSASQAAHVQTRIVENGALTGALNWYRAMPFTADPGFLRKVTVPTTHVWSTDDNALGRRGAELTEQCVSGPYRLRILEGINHWIPEQAPAELAAIIVETIGMAGAQPSSGLAQGQAG